MATVPEELVGREIIFSAKELSSINKALEGDILIGLNKDDPSDFIAKISDTEGSHVFFVQLIEA